jgi:hypothetical protein
MVSFLVCQSWLVPRVHEWVCFALIDLLPVLVLLPSHFHGVVLVFSQQSVEVTLSWTGALHCVSDVPWMVARPPIGDGS